jgi:hypothetical protein
MYEWSTSVNVQSRARSFHVPGGRSKSEPILGFLANSERKINRARSTTCENCRRSWNEAAICQLLTLKNESMNAKQRIRAVAASVIFAGAGALGVLSARPALATSCADNVYCVPYNVWAAEAEFRIGRCFPMGSAVSISPDGRFTMRSCAVTRAFLRWRRYENANASGGPYLNAALNAALKRATDAHEVDPRQDTSLAGGYLQQHVVFDFDRGIAALAVDVPVVTSVQAMVRRW